MPVGEGETLSLLLVEDDQVDRMAVRRALRRAGLEVEVEEAGTVAAAADKLAEKVFDCAIVDYNLPDGEGFKVLDAAREAPEPVPCIVLTGQGDEDLAVDLMKEGARDYIPKNALSPDRLHQSLRYVVRVARAEREARRARMGQEFLVTVSAELAQSLDLEATLDRVPRVPIPHLADAALLHLLDEETCHVRVATRDEGGKAGKEVLRRAFTAEPDGESVLGAVLHGREPVWREEVDDAFLESWARDPEHRTFIDGLSPTSLISAPLLARGRVLGALTLLRADGGGRPYEPHDFAVAQNLASRAALAVDNARLYLEARQAARARDEMLAVVSHDLRNPLNVIATSAALILEIPLPEEKKTQQLKVIRRTTDRMNRLIQDLLDVTGIESGNLSIDAAPLDVGTLLEEACASMETVATDESVELRCELPDGDLEVEADRERILQVFGNLIGNALKFTPEGGVITVGARKEGGVASFWVEDTGPGIPQEDLPHLFERFWKGKQSGGTGLGLPIARGIVEVHGGSMSVESREGEGTRFTFTLPLPGSPVPAGGA